MGEGDDRAQMLTLGIAIVLVLAAIAFAFWLVRTMLERRCPVCAGRGEEGMLIPVIPGLRWWCLACGEVFTPEEVHAGTPRARDEASAPDEEQAPESQASQPQGTEAAPPRLDV